MEGYSKSKPETIQLMFDTIASRYDKTNAILSFGLHHKWNASLIKHVVIPTSPKILVDLCAGTGEIAFRGIHAAPSLENVYLIDFSKEMLACAKKKAEKLPLGNAKINYLQADVESIPLPDHSVDCITMAYGIRNVSNREKCMREVFRVLKTGGSIGILELTRPDHKILRFGHTLYLQKVLPLLGKLLTSDKKAYRYLCDSIHCFIRPEEIKQELTSIGFRQIRQKSFLGGIATLLLAQKL